VSTESGVYGSDVVERSYWGGGDYSSWIDLTNSLPPGLLQRYFVFAQPTADTNNVGTAVVRIQIWRQINSPAQSLSPRRAYQLVWQRRVLLLPCNATHGALHAVRLQHTTPLIQPFTTGQDTPDARSVFEMTNFVSSHLYYVNQSINQSILSTHHSTLFGYYVGYIYCGKHKATGLSV